jgi:hypothetical protein
METCGNGVLMTGMVTIKMPPLMVLLGLIPTTKIIVYIFYVAARGSTILISAARLTVSGTIPLSAATVWFSSGVCPSEDVALCSFVFLPLIR